jgi:hypothetical protein
MLNIKKNGNFEYEICKQMYIRNIINICCWTMTCVHVSAARHLPREIIALGWIQKHTHIYNMYIV